ncbi:MAG: glycosyltransferase family 39 protein [Candidatus Omnitrophica bacterium]|nr:glycosyltransferase family 39 protein [Candidatus Omnitrophota bacterium]
MGIIIFLLMNLIVAWCGYLLSYKLLKITGFIDGLISWFILYFAQIVFSELILGIMGVLYLENVILLNLAILLLVIYFSRGKTSSFSTNGVREAFIELFKNKIVLLGASLLLGFGLVKIAINLVNPPFGWDCLNYHFVFPVEWLKKGNLDIPITISDDPSPSYYPINGSLFFLWLIFPFKNVFLADLGQVPFFILAFLAIYSISRKLNLNKELSFYAASLFLITPNVFKQLEIAYVDVMVAALFVTSINFLLALFKDLSFKSFILWAISFGLSLGTKTTAVVYGIFTFLFFIALLLKNVKRIHFKKIIVYFMLFAFLVIIFGGFSYIRNFIQTRNPFYPAEIQFFGKVLFKGVMPFSTYRSHWTKEDFNLEKFLFHEGLGLQFIILVIPSMIFCLPLLLLKRKKDINISYIFMAFLPILLYLSFLLFMPQFWTRYLYPIFAVNFVIAMYTVYLVNLHIHKNILRFIVGICYLASIFELASHLELISSIILSILFFIILSTIKKLKFNLILIVSIFIIITLHYLNINYNQYEFKRYFLKSPFPREEKEAWVWLNDNTKASRIAYVGRPDVLPLYGSFFKNNVYYISVNKINPVKLHYFPNARYIWTKDFITLHKNLELPGNYRENPEYSIWLKNLESENIDYLVVYSLHQVKEIVFPIENNWAKNNPNKFILVFGNETVHIYRILK